LWRQHPRLRPVLQTVQKFLIMGMPLLQREKQRTDEDYYYLFKILVFVAFLGTISLAFLGIFFLRPTLRGDEALYWDMSRNLALGYASKPPAIAYVIRMTTLLFGHEEWALRLPAITLMILFAFCAYKTSKAIFETALAGWITIYILLFDKQYLGNLQNVTTNNLLYLFWILAILCYWRAIQGNQRSWTYLGIAVGLGFLSKYSILFLVVSLLLHLTLYKPSFWLQKGIWKAMTIALIINTGVIYWNLQYSLLSFTHTMRILEDSQATRWHEFILGQIGALDPVAFIAYSSILVVMIIRIRSFPGKNVLLACALIPILFYYAVSLTRALYPHWLYPGWLGAMLGCGYFSFLVVRYWPGHKRLIFNIFLALFSLHIMLIAYYAVLILSGQVPHDNNPFKHKWPQIWHSRLPNHIASNPFIFSTNYSSSARLAYYTPGRPRTYCIEMVMQQEPNQYDVWGGWENLVGRDGLLVEVQEPEVVVGFADELVKGEVFSAYKLLEVIEGETSGSILNPDLLPITIVLMKDYSGKPPDQFLEERNRGMNKTPPNVADINRLASLARVVADHIPHSGRAQTRCADLLLVAGNKQEALHYFERSLELAEKPEARLELLAKTAQLYYETGNSDKATELFDLLFQQEPENAVAIEGLADIAFQQQAYEDAERYYLLLGKIGGEKAEKAAEFLMRIGIYRQQQKQYDVAQRLFMAAATYSPQHAVARLYLGDIEKEKKQYASAILSYSQFMFEDPESYEGAARINALLEMLGDTSQAMTTWTKIARQLPLAVLPHLQMGLALEQGNRFAEAAAAFIKAADNSNAPDKAHLYAATALVLANNVDEGLLLLRNTLEAAPDIVPIALERLIATGPLFLDANLHDEFLQLCTISVAYLEQEQEVFRLATLFSENDAYDHAEKLYITLMSKPWLRHKAAAALDTLLQEQKSPDHRIETWQQLHQNHPDNAVMTQYLANALFDGGAFDDSNLLLRMLAANGELEASGRARLAILDILAPSEDSTALLRFLEEDPESKIVLSRLLQNACSTLLEQNERNKAHALAKHLVQITPEQEGSWLLLGSIYTQNDNADQALETYKAGVQAAPAPFRIAVELDALLDLTGQHARKVDIWQSILQRDPENTAAQLHLADALVVGSHLEKAVDTYRKFLEKAPNRHDVRIRYGGALIKLGKLQSGLAEIAEAITQAPSLNVMAGSICRQSGEHLMENEAFPAAIAAFEAGLHYTPESYPVAERYALALAQSGDFEAAANLCEKYSPLSADSLICAALASCFGTIEHANTLFQQAVSQWNNASNQEIELVTTVASKLQEEGKYALCERVLLSLEVLQPANLWHQVHLGETYAALGCYEEAIERYKTVLFLAPESQHTAALLDVACKELNLPKKHVAVWQSLVELHPGAFIPREYYEKAQATTR
jgi:tetratricopeptide (TPR) repeat protein